MVVDDQSVHIPGLRWRKVRIDWPKASPRKHIMARDILLMYRGARANLYAVHWVRAPGPSYKVWFATHLVKKAITGVAKHLPFGYPTVIVGCSHWSEPAMQ